MTAAFSHDAIVIGAGVNGLVAAAYLARSGKRVLVVEARATLGGLCETARFGNGFQCSRAAHALYALDPRVIKDLKLARHGLDYAVRDMALVGLRSDGNHVVLGRNDRASARNIARHSGTDAAAWPHFRRELFGLGRKIRALWWDGEAAVSDGLLRNAKIRSLARMGTAAWLDSWFESDALKATLEFDAHALPPLAAGSALLLLWRAAQEMCGRQGAVAIPRGGLGAVADALALSARRSCVEIRTRSAVADIFVNANGAAGGIVLESGEAFASPLVLSSLSRERTLGFPSLSAMLGFGEAAALRRAPRAAGSARVTLALDARPEIAGIVVPATARFVMAERPEGLVGAHAAAYAGRLPQDLTMEAIMPAAADPALAPAGHHIVSVLVSPLPVAVAVGWQSQKAVLAAKVVAALGPHIPGLLRHIVAVDVLTPDDVRDRFDANDAFGSAVGAERMLADWRSRALTPIPGLILCGACADPAGAVSGRAGRIGAALAVAQGARA
jgi:phytoene dehydrogenase-like protein